jgi:hypothetical protein
MGNIQNYGSYINTPSSQTYVVELIYNFVEIFITFYLPRDLILSILVSFPLKHSVLHLPEEELKQP